MVEKITQEQLSQLLKQELLATDKSDISQAERSPFFQLLVTARRDQVSQSITERQCEPGEIIFREGENGDTMYLIWSGKVAIVKGKLESPTILAFRGTGEIIGEMALLENRPRSASIIALDQVRLLGLNRLKFRQLLHDTPSASFSIMETLSARLRKSDEARIHTDMSERRLISQVSLLRSEKERLEELGRLRQETSELIIHDLRNPLSSIAIALKMFNLVLPEDVLQTNQELLQIAQTSVTRMQRLVDSLLEVSRIESGESEFQFSQFDLCSLVREVVERVSIIDLKQIQIHLHLPSEPLLVKGDREKIERVLTNLVDNALKYTPADGSIDIHATFLEGVFQVSVRDNGPGIPPEHRERIFQRFAQVDRQKDLRRGFGLGLAYCQLAVEGHGGRIWVESGEAGKGSCFTFTLPKNPHPPHKAA